MLGIINFILAVLLCCYAFGLAATKRIKTWAILYVILSSILLLLLSLNVVYSIYSSRLFELSTTLYKITGGYPEYQVTLLVAVISNLLLCFILNKIGIRK